MSNISEIIIQGVNKASTVIDGVVKDLNRAENGIKKVDFSGVASSAISAINPVNMLGAAAFAAATKFAMMVDDAIDTADEISKLSQKIGITTEALSTLKYAGDLSDVTLDQLSTSIGQLSKNLVNATRGTGDAATAFKDLNISVNDSNGNIKSADAILFEVADAFADMEDGVLKTDVAMKIFGRSGKDMIPLLNEGGGALRGLQMEARKYGLEISGETGKAAEEFNDTMAKFNAQLQGVSYRVLPGLLTMLTEVTSAMIDLGDASIDAGNKLEISANMYANALAKGVIMASEAHNKALKEAIKMAADQAREKMANLNDSQLRAEIDFTKKKIAAVKKLEMDESNKNTLAQLEAQLQVYTTKYEPIAKKMKDDAKKLVEEWKKLSVVLQQDIGIYLNPLEEKEKAIVEQHKIWLDQYKEQAGASELILRHQEKMLENLKNMNLMQAQALYKPLSITDMAQQELNPIGTENLVDPKNVIEQEIEKGESALNLFFDTANGRGSEFRQTMVGAFGGMHQAALGFYNMSNQKNAQLFAAQKAFAIAMAIINTYEGATKALAQGGIFGYLSAAAIIATGMAYVAQIKAATPASHMAATVQGTSLNNNNSSGSNNSVNTTNQNRQLTIIINGNVIDHTKFARELYPYLQQADSDYNGN